MKPETLRKYFGEMPPLDHYPLRDSHEFRWDDSEVVEYIMRHPQFMSNLFKQLTNSRAIVFHPATRTWRGYRFKEKVAAGCCQNTPSNSTSSSATPPSKTQSPLSERGTGVFCDGRQSPNPLTADDSDFDSRRGETEVPDDQW